MKRWMQASLLLAALLLLCSCGAKQEKSPSPTKPDNAAAAHRTDASSAAFSGETFSFSTTDMDGKAVSSADFAGAKVIMINLWEPWCGPCVKEMPDLQKLYTKYKDQGLVILGVASSDPTQVSDTVSRLGVTYPIVKSNAQFARFDTGYVPTTIFVDGDGNLLSAEPYIGARSSGDWEKIIVGYLEG